MAFRIASRSVRVGQLRRLRVDELAEEGPAALLDHPDASASTASRRAASSPTSTRRRSTSARSRATRCIPGSRGRTCAKGVVTPNQLEDPDRILYPLRRTGERGEGRVGARDVGRGARRHRRPHPQGDRRRPPPRADVSRRPARRGRLRQPRAAGVGRRRPQQPHERLLVVGAARALPVDAAPIGRRPTTPTRRRSCCCRRTSRPATTSTRTRSGSSRRKSDGATLIAIDPRLSNTSAKADLWLPAYSGHRRRRCCWRSRAILLDEELYDREFVRDVGELARVPARRAARICPRRSSASSTR